MELRHIADFDSPSRDRRRRGLFDRGFEPAIEPRGRNALIPDFMDAEDRLHELLDPLPRRAGDRHDRRAFHLWQESCRFLAQLNELGALTLDQIPFVDANHERPALTLDKIG